MRNNNKSYGAINDVNPKSDAAVQDGIPNVVEDKTNVPRLQCKQILILFICLSSNLFNAMIYSLQAPFYPAEARKHGCSPTEYGFVFAVYEAVVFLMSPVFGRYIRSIGPKCGVVVGLLIAGLSCVLFGFIDNIQGYFPFLMISFVLRITQGFGCSVYFIGINTVLFSHFPGRKSMVMSSLATMYGFGLLAGPALGGVLFTFGGFMLPFVVVGGTLMMAGLATCFLPYGEDAEVDVTSETGVGTLLKEPGIWLGALSVSTTSVCSGYLQANLELHLLQFQLPVIYLGLLFIITGGVYALTAPGWGWIIDKGLYPQVGIIFGAVSKFLGFALIGPLPFLNIEPKLELVIIGLVFSGLGSGGQMVAGFAEKLRAAVLSGAPDDPLTYGLVTAIFQSAYSIGATVGPGLGGIIFDQVGFRWGTLFPLALNLGLLLLTIIYLTCCINKKEQQESILEDPEGGKLNIL